MSAKMNLPKLRFGEFSDGWEEKKFEQVFKRVVTKNKENNLNVLTISAQQGLINQEEYFNKSVSAKDVRGYYLLEKNDFAYNKSYSKGYPLGAIKRLSKYDKGVVSTLYICFRIQKDSVLFLEQFFNSGKINENIHKIAQEGARNHGLLNISVVEFFKDIHLTLPSKPEQEKIASFLSSVDTKIEQLTKKKRLLEQYKKGVMQKIFSQELRFKDDDGSEYPEWVEKKLTSVGQIVAGGTPETVKEEYWNGNIQWFTPTEIKNKYISSSKRTITELGLKKSSAKLLPIGTLLLSSRATVGEISIALQECTTNQGFQSIVVNEKNNNEFMYYWVKKNKKEFLKRSSGSTFLEISRSEMLKIKIQLPPLKEQTKIANFLSSLDSKLRHVETQLSSTKQFKKALLQKMFV